MSDESKHKKGLSGEKLDPFAKIRLRPAAYMGQVKNVSVLDFCFDEESQTITKKTVNYNTGILHLFTEIMSNAIDNFWRSIAQGYEMNYIKVTVGMDSSADDYGWISITNDGYCIPVELREYSQKNYRTGKTTREMAYPADIFFSDVDSGTNYSDDANRKSSGLHGIGGKIVTALSAEMIVEHTDPNNKKKYYKYYREGGTIQETPVITSFTAKTGWTKVSFLPDFAYFEVEGIEEDFFSLLKRYVYEAAMITNLKVSLNEEVAVVKNLEKYVRFFFSDPKDYKLIRFLAPNGDECVLVAGDIPEVNIMDKPPQISWINGINTSEGGIHVDAWTSLIFPKLVKAFNNKKRGKDIPKIKVSAKRLYPWLTLYVRAESFGAIFESNSKKRFTGFKTINEEGVEVTCEKISLNNPDTKTFLDSISDAVDKMMKWDFIGFIEDQLIAEAEMAESKDATKIPKRISDEKYVDANMVNREPENCILLICEGTSAHAMASRLVPDLPGGQDYWGIYELRGKFLNLSKASSRKINKNKEFKILKQMTGLVPLVDYSTLESRKALRYGGFWLLTDADPDGIHIRGLVVSSLNKFWPSIVTKNPEDSMISDFNTAVVMAFTSKKKLIKKYYTLPAYEEDKHNLPKSSYVRYFKGLGSHEPKDTASYVDEMMIRRYYKDKEGSKVIEMAFSGSPAGRKDWMLQALNSVTEPEPFQIKGNLSLSNFVWNDQTPYVMVSLVRAIPSIWDGMKDSQRKCVFGGINQKYPKSTGTKDLIIVTGEIKALTEYHHGDLDATLARIAQDFPGSNNINLFIPSGEFGTRMTNGTTDIAKGRYLFTGPEDICKVILPDMDSPVLERLTSQDKGKKLEYVHYAPVVPLVLINGCEGIATGWATSIPAYNPLDIVERIRNWLAGVPFGKALKPWFRGFKGTIELQTDDKNNKIWQEGSSTPPHKWVSTGILTRAKKPWDPPPYTKGEKKVRDKGWFIEEIPIGMSINKVKEHINYYMTGTKTMKTKGEPKAKAKAKSKSSGAQVTSRITPKLRDFRDYSKPNRPMWEILPTKNFTPDIDTKNNFDFLKKNHSLNKMYLLNAQGIPTKYARPEDILEEWCGLRYDVYTKRKAWWLARWGRDLTRQEQKYKYVKAVVEKKLDLHQEDAPLEEAMLEMGLLKLVPDSKWKSAESVIDEKEEEEEIITEEEAKGNFDYLLSMQMRSMTVKRLKEISKEVQKIREKVDDYQNSTEADLWERDLQSFEVAYAKFLKTRKDM